MKSLEQEDGSFFGDKWGEVDTRFSYCALSILSLTGQLHSGIIDIPRAVNFIERLVNSVSLQLSILFIFMIPYIPDAATLTEDSVQSLERNHMRDKYSVVWVRYPSQARSLLSTTTYWDGGCLSDSVTPED